MFFWLNMNAGLFAVLQAHCPKFPSIFSSLSFLFYSRFSVLEHRLSWDLHPLLMSLLLISPVSSHSQLYFCRGSGFDACSTMLRLFYRSVAACAVFYAGVQDLDSWHQPNQYAHPESWLCPLGGAGFFGGGVREEDAVHGEGASRTTTGTVDAIRWSRSGAASAEDWFNHHAPQNNIRIPSCGNQTPQLIYLRQRDGQQRHDVLRWLQPPFPPFHCCSFEFSALFLDYCL